MVSDTNMGKLRVDLEDLMNRRAYGVSVSLDPALRVLLRPEGIGNLQIFSKGREWDSPH